MVCTEFSIWASAAEASAWWLEVMLSYQYGEISAEEYTNASNFYRAQTALIAAGCVRGGALEPAPTPTPPPAPPPAPTPTPTPTPEPPSGGSIFDTIINWIKTAISSITNSVTSWVTSARDWIVQSITGLVNGASGLIAGWIDNVLTWVHNAVDWATYTYNAIQAWVVSASSVIAAAVTMATAPIWSWINQNTGIIIGNVSQAIGNLQGTLSAAISSIQPLVASIGTQIQSQFTWIQGWLPGAVLQPLNTWWNTFIGKVFDFGSWVGKLFDSVANWFTVDVPGHSPRWTAIFDTMFDYLYRIFARAPASVATWFTWTMVQGFIGTVKPVSDGIMAIFDSFIARIAAAAQSAGRVTPENALGITNQLNSVGATVIAGLVGMTVAGNLTVLGSKIGLGNVSAMIYDLTNYKLLTGAFVGALAYAAIQTPLRYYYQNTFRPRLPSEGDAARMLSEDKISPVQYRQLLGYAGLPDRWHDNYEDMAYRPMSLVALSSLATAGGFDEAVYTEVLRDRGLKPKWRPYMLDLYRRKGQEIIKGTGSSVAITRYRQGYTDPIGLRDELLVMGYTDAEVSRMGMSADLQYATDYISDLIAAWQSQVRKKVLSLVDYRANLSTVIVVPERVDAMIMREIVNAPVEEPKAVGLSIAVTRFAQGETAEPEFRSELTLLGCPPIDIDRNVAAAGLVYAHDLTLDLITAYRDGIRANNLTLDDYRQALLGLGLVPERVEGLCLIERARLKPKLALKPTSPAIAYYATEIGKVLVDTVRRRRRKGAITRDEELARLIDTGYEPGEAAVIADNDQERLGKGVAEAEGPTEAG